MHDIGKVERLELIVEGVGRIYVKKDVAVTLSWQDDGTTLKVFLAPREGQ